MTAAGEPIWVGAEPGGGLAGESAGPPTEAGLGATAGVSVTDAEDDAVEICQELIRIPSVNLGEGDGDERAAAEYVAERLAEVGLEPTILQSAPRRTSVVARFEGADSSRGALLMHGHLDVVPAQSEDWQVDPFAGEIRDGCVWGRGAVDMKDSIAMSLAVVRALPRSSRKPPRDLVLAFVADEEAGSAGRLGIGPILRPLAKDGGGDAPMTANAMANMYMAIIDGSLVYARATGDSSCIARNLKTFRQQIEAMST